jgi:hypothetical protein
MRRHGEKSSQMSEYQGCFPWHAFCVSDTEGECALWNGARVCVIPVQAALTFHCRFDPRKGYESMTQSGIACVAKYETGNPFSRLDLAHDGHGLFLSGYGPFLVATSVASDE